MDHRFDVVYEFYGSKRTGWNLQIRGSLDEDPADAVAILQKVSCQLGAKRSEEEKEE